MANRSDMLEFFCGFSEIYISDDQRVYVEKNDQVEEVVESGFDQRIAIPLRNPLWMMAGRPAKKREIGNVVPLTIRRVPGSDLLEDRLVRFTASVLNEDGFHPRLLDFP